MHLNQYRFYTSTGSREGLNKCLSFYQILGVRDSAMHKRSLQNEAILVNQNLVSVKLTAKGYLF